MHDGAGGGQRIRQLAAGDIRAWPQHVRARQAAVIRRQAPRPARARSSAAGIESHASPNVRSARGGCRTDGGNPRTRSPETAPRLRPPRVPTRGGDGLRAREHDPPAGGQALERVGQRRQDPAGGPMLIVGIAIDCTPALAQHAHEPVVRPALPAWRPPAGVRQAVTSGSPAPASCRRLLDEASRALGRRASPATDSPRAHAPSARRSTGRSSAARRRRRPSTPATIPTRCRRPGAVHVASAPIGA